MWIFLRFGVENPWFIHKKIKKMLGKFHLRIEKKKEKVYNVNEIVCKNRDFESKSTKVRVSSSKKKRRGATENEEK